MELVSVWCYESIVQARKSLNILHTGDRYFVRKFPDLRYFKCISGDQDLGRFKVSQGQINSVLVVFSSYLSPFSKYLTSYFNDPDLEGFMVIQGQGS